MMARPQRGTSTRKATLHPPANSLKNVQMDDPHIDKGYKRPEHGIADSLRTQYVHNLMSNRIENILRKAA